MWRLPALLAMLSACNEAGIRVSNDAPEAEIVDPAEGGQVFEGVPVTLVGAATDSDNAEFDLEARWRVDGVTVCDWSEADDDGTTTCEAALVGGAAGQIVLQVRDPRGASGSDRISVVVVPTDAPTATITAPEADGVYYSDQLITLAGVVADAEDAAEALTATWTSTSGVDLTRVNATPTSDGSVEGSALLPEGLQELRLTVTDSTGKTGSDTVTLAVGPPNSAPSCALVAPEDRSAGETGALVVLEGTAEDVDVPADMLQATFSSNLDGELDTLGVDSDGTVSLATSSLSVGTHTLTLTVRDEVDGSCTDSVLYTVGTPPQVAILSPLDEAVFLAGEPITFEAEVSDREDLASELALSWVSSIDGVLDDRSADGDGRVVFARDDLATGAHTITLTGTDSAGIEDTDLVTIRVNTPPTTGGLALTPDPATTDDRLVAVWSAPPADDDGDPLTTTWAWTVDGDPSPASTTETLESVHTAKGQRWTVSATVSDGLHAAPVAEAALVIQNTVPTLESLELLPAVPTSSDALTCVPGATSDRDADPVTLAYRWEIDGLPIVDGAAVLLPGRVRPGQSVQCFATPSDGEDVGLEVASPLRLVENRAPEIASVAITPEPAFTDDALTCVAAGVSDADGDAVELAYAWTVDGLDAGVEDATLGPDRTVRGMVVQCSVTPSDGLVVGVAVDSAPVRIADSPPEATEVTLTPPEPTEASVLTCAATGEDADGDPLDFVYSWSVDGLGIAPLGPTLTGADFDKGQSIVCTATPDGGVGADSPAVRVLNTPPVQPPVSLGPLGAVVGETVICAAPPPTDVDPADAGRLEQRYAWTVDGAPWGASGEALDTTGMEAGAAVVCEVTPSDPEEDGLPVVSLPVVLGTDCDEDGSAEDCPGLDCLDIQARGHDRGDGLYWVDPSETGLPYEAYCDMTTDGGGWTLLVAADGGSTYWGNNSPSWYEPGADAAPAVLDGRDHHGRSYDEQPTDEVRLCREGVERCYTFSHGYDLTLWDFFDGDISYVAYSHDSWLWADEGDISALDAWEAEMGETVRFACQWLGINYTTAWSAIGFMSDNNYGCESWSGARAYPHHDDGALGLGLQSCQDNNDCPAGGEGHLAGQTRHVGGVDDSGVIGPWYVFGRRAPELREDADGDGYSVVAGDCDDGDPSVHPLAGDTWADGVDGDCDGLDCEAGWYDDATYYALCDVELTWSDAQQACWDGGHTNLATLDTDPKEDFVDGLIDGVGSPGCAESSMGCPWIGVVRGPAGWGWADGTPMAFEDWHPLEPTGDGDCAHYNRYGVGAWNDADCDITLIAAVCQTTL